MSDTTCEWPWATCLELQSDPQFVAASAGPGYVQEGPTCTPRLACSSTGPRGRSAKVLKHPQATQLSLSWILLRPWQGRATRSQEGGDQKVGLADLPGEGGSSQVPENVGEIAPTSQPHNSVTHTPCICPDLYILTQVSDSSAGSKLYPVGLQGV